MPLFLARWPDGSCSVVKASNKDDAIYLLDEFGNAESAEISRLKNFMMDFVLTEENEYSLHLNQMGDETHEEIFKKAYPILDNAHLPDDQDPAYPAMLAKVIAEEKGRVKTGLGRLGKTPEAIALQKETDMPAVVVDRIVNQLDRELKRKRPQRDAN